MIDEVQADQAADEGLREEVDEHLARGPETWGNLLDMLEVEP